MLWWGKLRGISLLIRNEEMINKTWEKGFSKRKSFRPVAEVLQRQVLQISVKIFVQLSFRFWGGILFDGARIIVEEGTFGGIFEKFDRSFSVSSSTLNILL